jgi:hypothetical protein
VATTAIPDIGPDVVTLRHDIDEAVIDADLDLDVGIIVQQLGELGQELVAGLVRAYLFVIGTRHGRSAGKHGYERAMQKRNWDTAISTSRPLASTAWA